MSVPVPRRDELTRRGLRTVWLTAGMVTVGVLPGFLLAALAVLVREDIPFDEAQLGVSVACGFGTSALLSAAAGRLTSRLGSRIAFSLACGGVAAGLVVIATATSWWWLTGGMVIAGAGNSAMQVAANLRIARGVATTSHGVAYGVKQSAVPSATMVAGLAVPAVGITLGWRLTFVAAAVVAVAVMVRQLLDRSTSDGARPDGPRRAIETPSHLARSVPLFTLGVGCAAGAATCLATFLTEYLIGTGWEHGRAGVLLAAGSLGCIVARVTYGWRMDARSHDGFLWMVIQLAIGAVALVALALSDGAAIVVVPAVLVAFAAGWGWSGVFIFALVREAPEAPATVTGKTQAGVFAGGALGPLLFGLLASSTSFPLAWVVTAGVMALGGVFVARGRHHLPALPVVAR